ncbi:MAG: hypothetical protein DRJ03_03270 [Chloroflexi bacterium]|nr:MAG: hypothetical protein DRJ03_03270 [Chloroflexota bacterium]
MNRKMYDATAGFDFLLGQLTHLEAKIYSTVYADIVYPNVIPISTEAGPNATSVAYYTVDQVGKAKFVGPGSLDIPMVDISGDMQQMYVHLGAVGYGYTDEEIRQAISLGQDLPTVKAIAARRAFEEHAQEVYLTGDANHNLAGFLNNPNVTAATVVNPGSGTTWAVKSPDEILADIITSFSAIREDSKLKESADTLLLPVAQYNHIANTRLSTYTETSILQYIVKNITYIKSESDIIPINQLDGAGAGATDRMIIYTKNEEKLVGHMPMPLTWLPPLRKERGFVVAGEYKLSGIEFRYPGSARYADGI